MHRLLVIVILEACGALVQVFCRCWGDFQCCCKPTWHCLPLHWTSIRTDSAKYAV